MSLIEFYYAGYIVAKLLKTEMAQFPEPVPIWKLVLSPQNQNRTGSEPVPKKLIIVPFAQFNSNFPEVSFLNVR